MVTEEDDNKRKTPGLAHSIYDYVMGVLWLCLGGFFLLHNRFGVEIKMDKGLATIFGVSALLYGLFRIYRGYKKRY
jgi:hypothetical protein